MAFDFTGFRAKLAGALRDLELELQKAPKARSRRKKGTAATSPKDKAKLEKVRQLLRSWQKALKGRKKDKYSPETLYYIPNQQLQDAGIVPLLQVLGPASKFLHVTLYFADLHIYRTGEGKEPDNWEMRRQSIRELDDDELEDGHPGEEVGDDEEFEFDYVDEQEIRIQSMHNLDGEEVGLFVDKLVDEEDIIPLNFIEELGKPDESKHECEDGIYGDIKLTHWYNRPALVIAPRGVLSDARQSVAHWEQAPQQPTKWGSGSEPKRVLELNNE
ncbi:hypothetical protein SCHPADRAFT_995307 [Schizopora paradoxa]|uniref:Uncharacterized protein n=1 Tax=Schizopora paradoxa TaxID=27342 RepID=A0A0H2RWJ3_9AGAM|nr:hypothetical protein SCHPADRAFT_995307 [Schizopora paradoxa]